MCRFRAFSELPWTACRRARARVARKNFRSSDDRFDDFAVNIGEPEVAAGVAVSEFSVIEAELIQDGRVEVVDVDFVFDGLEAEVVRGAVGDAAFDAAAGEESRECRRVVVAAAAQLFQT